MRKTKGGHDAKLPEYKTLDKVTADMKLYVVFGTKILPKWCWQFYVPNGGCFVLASICYFIIQEQVYTLLATGGLCFYLDVICNVFHGWYFIYTFFEMVKTFLYL